MSVDSTTDPALVAALPPAAPDADFFSIIDSPTTDSSKVERNSLTLDQRRALRRWVLSQPTRPSHKTCIDWFFAQYGQHISQSTVSHSLSSKYARLDAENSQLSGSRLRFGNWPDVERLVLLWFQQVQASGRTPTNEELGEKAKTIFLQLPRYKGEMPPNFSPGWIHRFKKRYGLLVRRQRRHSDLNLNPAEDISYLADCVPRFLVVAHDTSPGAIREHILRVIGVEASLTTCALVRDEILHRSTEAQNIAAQQTMLDGSVDHAQAEPHYVEDDAETVLQNALQELQESERAAEDHAASVREQRNNPQQQQQQHQAPTQQQSQPQQQQQDQNSVGMHHSMDDETKGIPNSTYATAELALASIPGPPPPPPPQPVSEEPIRCPYCRNVKMLRSIKLAVEHMSTHVEV